MCYRCSSELLSRSSPKHRGCTVCSQISLKTASTPAVHFLRRRVGHISKWWCCYLHHHRRRRRPWQPTFAKDGFAISSRHGHPECRASLNPNSEADTPLSPPTESQGAMKGYSDPASLRAGAALQLPQLGPCLGLGDRQTERQAVEKLT